MTTKQKSEPTMRVLKSATCPTLSGKSKLTYHIGCDHESVIHLRVFSNLGSGNFSKEWIRLDKIRAVFDKHHKGSPITAYLLQPLYRGKSVNTPAFLLAVLAGEKVVRVLKGKKRDHEILDPAGFIAGVEKLIASGVDLKVKEPSKTVGSNTKKTASKTVIETPIKKTVTKKTVRKTPVKKTAGKTTGSTVTKTVKKAVTKKAAIKKRSAAQRKTV